MSAAEPRRSPYQGLTPFDERDAGYFFGREKDARLISADLFAAPFSVLYGASGVGKSSVLRAGVVPLLRASEDVMVVVFNTWQNEPTTQLKGLAAEALFAIRNDREARDAVLFNEYDPLAKFLPLMAKTAKRRLMIILDQFEEYSLYHPEGGMFGQQFPPATALDDLSISFLISLREDALAGLDRFEGKIPGLFDNIRRIDHLDAGAAREAIRKPLEQYAIDHPDEPRITADDDLVDAVIEDVRANRLGFEGTGRGTEIPSLTTTSNRIEAPYLQLVMTRLWDDARNREVTTLELGTFNSLGKAKKIVEDHLDAVLGRLTDEERDAAARAFEYLVTPSGTKIAHTVRDLSISAGVDATLLRTMMDRLSSGTDRVLRPVAALPETPAEPRYEIFHDRLAPAILAWRTAYVRKKELAEANLKEIERRRAEPFDLQPNAPKKRMATDDPPYALLADLLREGALNVVLGSGASTSARPESVPWGPGAPFPPTGWELTQYLAHQIGFPADELRPGSLGEVASSCVAAAGHFTLQKQLHEIFRAVTEPIPIHAVIASVAKQRPLLVLTSTFDALLEQALEAHNVAFGVAANDFERATGEPYVIWNAPGISFQRMPAKAPVMTISHTWIYKIFGSVFRDRSSLSTFVISEEDEMNLFVAFSAGRLPPPAFAPSIANKRTLFLGMGLRSWTQRLLISNPNRRSDELRGWAVARGVSTVDTQRWQQAGIQVFDRDLNDVAAKLGTALER